MHQVLPEEAPKLRAFFPTPPANAYMLDAFFDGRAVGVGFVDDLEAPRGCVVAVNSNVIFFGGRPAMSFMLQVVRQLRMGSRLHVVWSEGRLPLEPRPDTTVERLEFLERDDPDNRKLRVLVRGLDASIELRRITRTLFDRCAWGRDVAAATGSVEAFLNHGIGFCLMQGDDILSEAYACFWGERHFEVACITAEGHRGHGYAGLVCAHLIEVCEALGFTAYWSCDAHNETSVRLADRLGFVQPRAYRLLSYERKMVGTMM